MMETILEIIAVTCSSVALRIMFEPGAATLGWRNAPFGWHALALVQALAIFPATLLMARTTARRWRASPSAVGARGWIFAAVVMLLAVGAAGGAAAESWRRSEPPLLVQVLLHEAFAALIQFPWLMAAAGGSRPTLGWSRILAAATAAVFVSWLHAANVIERETRKTTDLLQKGKLSRAWPKVVGLCDMASRQPILGKAPPSLQRELAQALAAMTQSASRPLAENGSDAARMERARLLAILGRLDEAEELLEPLADAHIAALMLRATICQERERFADSDQLYRTALAKASGAEPVPMKSMVQAYDGLAYNARASGQFTRAEAIYVEALERLPQARAYFQTQLGRHYHLAGRPVLAIHHLRAALALEPQLESQIRPLLSELASQTPSCLAGR